MSNDETPVATSSNASEMAESTPFIVVSNDETPVATSSNASEMAESTPFVVVSNVSGSYVETVDHATSITHDATSYDVSTSSDRFNALIARGIEHCISNDIDNHLGLVCVCFLFNCTV